MNDMPLLAIEFWNGECRTWDGERRKGGLWNEVESGRPLRYDARMNKKPRTGVEQRGRWAGITKGRRRLRGEPNPNGRIV